MKHVESETKHACAVLPGILRKFTGMAFKTSDHFYGLRSEKCWGKWRELVIISKPLKLNGILNVNHQKLHQVEPLSFMKD